MINLVLLYTVISWLAGTRGHKSPLFGGFGLACYFIIANVLAVVTEGYSEFVLGLLSDAITIGGFALLIYSLPARDHRSAPKTTRTPFVAIGLVCLATAGMLLWGWWSVMRQGRSDTPTLLVVGLCLTAAITCFRFSAQAHLSGASAQLARDPRPPILFLRSFASKSCRKKPKLGFLPMYPQEFGETFEQFIASAAEELGPFIALGDPDDYLPTFGAAKVYLNDNSWKPSVTDFLDRSACVIILEGATQSLKWELGEARTRCSPGKIFLVSPPAPFPRLGWAEFARLLAEAGFEVPPDPGAGALIGFDKCFHPVVLTGRGDGGDLVTALRAAIVSADDSKGGGAEPFVGHSENSPAEDSDASKASKNVSVEQLREAFGDLHL